MGGLRVGHWTAGRLVERLGGHPLGVLGLDPGDPQDRERWWTAACLLASRASERVAFAACLALAGRGLDRPADLAARPADAAAALAEAGLPDPDGMAARLARAAHELATGAGSLDALAGRADDIADLVGRLARLAPGIGSGAVLRFLRPLRDVWPAAAETPLDAAARAAAVHVGLLGEGEDEEGEPGALRAALAREDAAPPLADAEAALERLGRAACLRGRTGRCPLGDGCPAR